MGNNEKKIEPVTVGLIGYGNMGSQHIEFLNAMPSADVVAVCDRIPSKAQRGAARAGCNSYHDFETMLDKEAPQAIVVATPHFDHVPIAVEAFRRGIHVLLEKPVAVEATEARRAAEEYEKAKSEHTDLVYAAMFNQRTYGHWLKIKDLIDGGELGRIVRATWIITDWFRTQHYYDTGNWRATWAGEGGGVLVNQCPHNLDLYQWLFGMPQAVQGFASLGKYHDIEVEDEVTAYFEHENGMVGHFITTTAESPGTNRLEVVGERGRLVFEDGTIELLRNRKSMLDFLSSEKKSFTHVESWPCRIPYHHHGEGGHRIVLERFLSAVQGRDTPVAEGNEGLHSVILANAIMQSAFSEAKINLPMDEAGYSAKLAELKKTSRYTGAEDESGKIEDLAGSY